MHQFSPCFVIPNYNHSKMFDDVVRRLNHFELPIIVVNDGSDEKTSVCLRKISESNPLISLVELLENQGKGGAVMAGMRYASEHSYTHALQVDADGQHNLEDVITFLNASNENLETLICGHPVYDDSVPASRLIPRYITHFWVWVETLSFSIVDSMCGFRVYPLASVIPIIEQNSLGKRMDFDIEILVRLYWQSVPMKFLPTKVIYPETGSSHFQIFRDNWLITKMHTRLFFGMLIRLPKLLENKRKSDKSQIGSIHWSAKMEKGSSLGIRFLVWSYKTFGKRAFELMLHPIVAYFVLTSSSEKKASIGYQKQLMKYQGRTASIGWRQVYSHFYQFSVAAIDKIGAWTGNINCENVIVHNNNINHQLVEEGRGAVFIGSHLGNLELGRAIGKYNKNIVINAVVFNKHALKFQDVLNQSNPNVRLNLIHVESVGSDTAILLKEKVDAGEVVIIVGDRTSTTAVGRVEYVDFLGKKAPFSQGPFILASLLECPVYLIFCIKESGIYNVYLEAFSDSMKLPRKSRKETLSKYIQNYADRLSHYCQKEPLQWFNFYDFWQADDEKIIRRNDKLG